MNGAEGREPVRVHHIPTGADHNNYGGRLISGGIGFGLLGSAMGRFMDLPGWFWVSMELDVQSIQMSSRVDRK